MNWLSERENTETKNNQKLFAMILRILLWLHIRQNRDRGLQFFYLSEDYYGLIKII